MSDHIEVRPLGPREYAVVVTEGVDTSHHRVVVSERLLDELLLEEDDAERLVFEAVDYLVEVEHADAIPDELVLSELIGEDEHFLPEMRARLG